jgi:hypothetical protein
MNREGAENISEYAKVQTGARAIKDRGGEAPKGINLGVCTNCANLVYTQNRYGSYVAYCNAHTNSPRIHEEDPPVTCSLHYPKGAMSLIQMFAIAWPIEGRGKVNKIGFITEDELKIEDDFEMRLELDME